MALVDEYTFKAKAGRGGDGVVRWRREKFIPKGGPCGGNGGKGGDVYVEAVRDITMLNRIVSKDSYKAEPGEPGGSSSKHGANGSDIIIRLPVGSVVTNTTTGNSFELISEGERVLVLKGGKGGYGNETFKSSTNQRPMQATKGEDGEQGTFFVELRLIANVGIVGLPNAGKTSLLNAITNAGAKVGDYPFTTLDPNLGAYHGIILADIPGLIEGASQGKGLGHKFLRHISRTSVILHCISLEQDNILDAYRTIREEIAQFEDLATRRELVVLTKEDTVSEKERTLAIAALEKETGAELLCTVSVLDDDSIKNFGDTLVAALRKY